MCQILLIQQIFTLIITCEYCYVLMTLYVDFESSQLFHLGDLQMLLNISIACWYFSLVDNQINTSFNF